MKDDRNDNELLYYIREVGTETKEILLKKYESVVRVFAHNKFKQQAALGVDFDDFVQEGYIGLNNAIDTYDMDGNAIFYTYACICIKSQMNNHIKKYYRVKEIKDYKYYDGEESCYLISESGEEYTLSNYYNDELIKIKSNIPLIRSCVFELRYNGFSYLEISKLLDIKMKEIDMHLYKVRKFLKERDLKNIFL